MGKDPSLWDGWFGQGDFLREGEVGTFRALFYRPAAFYPYIHGRRPKNNFRRIFSFDYGPM